MANPLGFSETQIDSTFSESRLTQKKPSATATGGEPQKKDNAGCSEDDISKISLTCSSFSSAERLNEALFPFKAACEKPKMQLLGLKDVLIIITTGTFATLVKVVEARSVPHKDFSLVSLADCFGGGVTISAHS